MNQSTTSLIGAVFLLEIGSALQGVLLPVRAEMAGFQAETIGALGTLYYAGFVLGCLRLPAVIRRIGHIRSYAALSAIAASLALLHALVIAPLAWMGLRVVAGFCFAGLFMVTESWINDRATPETRGRIFGRYMLATWFGVIFGKLVYSVALPDAFHLFALASIAVGLSMVPLTMTNGAMPAIPQPARVRLAEAFRTAPIGFLGCLAVGLANSAFWTFGPLFARNEIGPGLPVSLFMVFCVLGGAVAQWPVGRLSDQTDRRWVILGLCVASIAISLSIAFAHETTGFGLYGRGAIFGAATLSLYSICVAYANDRADPAGYVDVSSHLLLVFGVGAIAGPFLAGVLISAHGYPSLFLFMAGAESLLALLVLVGVFASAPVPQEERTVFASQPPLSHGTQAAIPLQQDADPANRA
jgi:MFS family permease